MKDLEVFIDKIFEHPWFGLSYNEKEIENMENRVKEAIQMDLLDEIIEELTAFVGDNPTRAEIILDHYQKIVLEELEAQEDET